MEKRFIEYIHIKENDDKISYSTKLQELKSGAETNVYWFQLKNAPQKISKPLVLRVYKKHSPTHRATIEEITQNYLAVKGYPVPRVYIKSIDSSDIGAPFIVMDYVSGEMLGRYNKNVPQTLAELSIKLHKIDPELLIIKLRAAGINEKYFTGLTEREQYIPDNEIEWLLPGLEWIKENKPKSNLAVVPGDIHANNIVIENGEVSGVLDWAGLIDDNIRDVGSTVIL
jgi:aminoglycoside phosphotransferase (APT) family kinase protein